MFDKLRAKRALNDSTPGSETPAAAVRPLLRRADQAVVAMLVLFALVGMGVYWFVNGGHRGELIEIDRAEPLTARFLVDINSAEWPELAELPDIGEILARRIVESRAAAGRFADHDDLLRVPGIGPLTLEKLRPYLLPVPDQEDVAGGAAPLPGT
jgi:competence protein ComEA